MVMNRSHAEMNKVAMPADISIPKDETFENLLLWAHNRKNNVNYNLCNQRCVLLTIFDTLINNLFAQPLTYNCMVRIDGVRTRKGWNYPSCGDNKCRKGATHKQGKFWCDSCDKSISYPVSDIAFYKPQLQIILYAV
jgi:hypothetical protein